jgi:hypothetical protein
MHYENSLIHKAAGIDDDQGQVYKQYDYSGRAHASLANKAQWAAVRGLAANSFRKDSPIRTLQQRFPDKYDQPSF